MKRLRARSAMTLLEVIVALTVAGAALAAGAAVLGFLADQQQRTGAEQVAAANAVRATMRNWLSATRLTVEGDAEFRGAPRARVARISSRLVNESEGSDELYFLTSAPTEVAEAGTY